MVEYSGHQFEYEFLKLRKPVGAGYTCRKRNTYLLICKPMSVVILSNNRDYANALTNVLLARSIPVSLVVLEKPKVDKGDSNTSFLGRIRKAMMPLKSRMALELEREAKVAFVKRLEAYFLDNGLNGSPQGVAFLETPSLNEATIVTAVKNANPKVCVVMGNPNLVSRLFALPSIATVNVHFSILPEYRGTRSEFWQCYNRNFQDAGCTFFTYSSSGEIENLVLSIRQSLDQSPEPYNMRLKNLIATFEHFPSVIDSILHGTATLKPMVRSTTPVYSNRDFTQQKIIDLYSRMANA